MDDSRSGKVPCRRISQHWTFLFFLLIVNKYLLWTSPHNDANPQFFFYVLLDIYFPFLFSLSHQRRNRESHKFLSAARSICSQVLFLMESRLLMLQRTLIFRSNCCIGLLFVDAYVVLCGLLYGWNRVVEMCIYGFTSLDLMQLEFFLGQIRLLRCCFSSICNESLFLRHWSLRMSSFSDWH